MEFWEQFWDNEDSNLLKERITNDYGWKEGAIQNNIDYLGITEDYKKIFEIGAGFGRLLKYLRDVKGKRIKGCDYSKAMVDNSKKFLGEGIDLNLGDGKINEKDCEYDLVFSIIVFQHIRDVEIIKKYIEESHRILKNEGKFVFQITCLQCKTDSISILHEPNQFIDKMNELGFKEIKLEKVEPNYLISGIK